MHHISSRKQLQDEVHLIPYQGGWSIYHIKLKQCDVQPEISIGAPHTNYEEDLIVQTLQINFPYPLELK